MFNTVRSTMELMQNASAGETTMLASSAQLTSLKVTCESYPTKSGRFCSFWFQATGDSFVDGYMGYVSYRKQLDQFVSDWRTQSMQGMITMYLFAWNIRGMQSHYQFQNCPFCMLCGTAQILSHFSLFSVNQAEDYMGGDNDSIKVAYTSLPQLVITCHNATAPPLSRPFAHSTHPVHGIRQRRPTNAVAT
jgi:hypothetical protein